MAQYEAVLRGVDNILCDYGDMYLGIGGSDSILSEPVPPFFQIIENFHGGEKAGFTLTNLMDPDLLKSSAESLVVGILVSATLQSNSPLAAAFADHDVTNSKAAMSSRLFFSSIDPNSGSTTIQFFPTGSDGPHSRTVKPTRWWRPASARTWFTVVAATLAIAIIGVLEGIQQISDRNNGFVSLRSLNLGTTVLAQYVPAAVAVGINLMFGSIELVVAGITPFPALKKGNLTWSRSLALDYLTKSGPHTFFQSLVNRHLALRVILLMIFVAFFLSIVVPGLYTYHNLPSISNRTVLHMDKFDPSGVDVSFDDRGAATMLNLLTHYNIEYPQWVHDEFALPQFASLSLATDEGDEVESVTSRTEWMSYSYSYAGLDRDYSERMAVNSTIEQPWSLCSNSPRNVSSASTVKWVQTFLSHNDTMPDDYVRVGRGNILNRDEALSKSYHGELTIDGDGTKKSNSGSGLNPTYITLADWDCPSLAFTVGTISFKPDPRNAKVNFTNPYDESRMWNKLLVDADVSTIVCAQHVQRVQTNVTLDYPGMTISTAMPPQPDERTVQWLKNIDGEEGWDDLPICS
ncbi:hypothetical protein E8E11_004003 [Didymella keratinophila]|nr:hypothetical protein E8E11_004003 [Didymella keratinophila]